MSPFARFRPRFILSEDPAARALRALRFSGPVPRAELARRTGLSASTVSRAITALIEAGVVREGAGLVEPPGGGRPAQRIQLDARGPVAVACHIGRLQSVVAVADLGHRILDHEVLVTPSGEPAHVLTELADTARRLLSGYTGRQLVGAGIAAAFRVSADGLVDHDLLDWEAVPAAEIWERELGVPVALSPHVEAIAAAEALVRDERHVGSTLLVYGRESVGCAQVVDDAVLAPSSGPGDLSGLRTEPTVHLGYQGSELGSTASDSALLDVARGLGLEAADLASLYELGSRDALADALLAERARVLGRAVGTVVSITRPDRVVLAGQAFTSHPRYLGDVAAGYRDVAIRGVRAELRVSRAGERVQLDAAVATALDAVTSAPLQVISTAARERRAPVAVLSS